MPLQHAHRSEVVELWVRFARQRKHNQGLDLLGLRKAFNDAQAKTDVQADRRGLLSLHREVRGDIDRLLSQSVLAPSDRRYLLMLEYWERKLSKLL